MFESDDFGDVLDDLEPPRDDSAIKSPLIAVAVKSDDQTDAPKRRKRKFPGPAGLLPENLDETANSTNILSTQALNSSQGLTPTFSGAAWSFMLKDVQLEQSSRRDIVDIREGQHLANRRVPLLIGYVQSIHKRLHDTSITLRDPSGEIQGTLHHDAWESYNRYLIPQCSVLVLKNVTLLTAGGLLKKTYLNISLNTIAAIYCDSDNLGENDENQQTNATGDNNYSTETVRWNDSDISIIRNSTSTDRSPKTTTNPNETLAKELLDGIDAEDFFGDFS